MIKADWARELEDRINNLKGAYGGGQGAIPQQPVQPWKPEQILGSANFSPNPPQTAPLGPRQAPSFEQWRATQNAMPTVMVNLPGVGQVDYAYAKYLSYLNSIGMGGETQMRSGDNFSPNPPVTTPYPGRGEGDLTRSPNPPPITPMPGREPIYSVPEVPTTPYPGRGGDIRSPNPPQTTPYPGRGRVGAPPPVNGYTPGPWDNMNRSPLGLMGKSKTSNKKSYGR